MELAAVEARRDFTRGRGSTALTRGWYVATVGLGLAASAAQLVVLPAFLTPEDFGRLVLGIAATQAGILIGDFGVLFVAANSRLPLDRAGWLRETSFSVASVSIAVASLCAVWFVGDRGSRLCVLLGLLTAWVLWPARLKESTCELTGDEIRATRLGFVWQNAPKLGMLALAWSGSPSLIMLAGLISAAVMAGVHYPRCRAIKELSDHKSELPSALAVAVGPYLMLWADAIVLAAQEDVGTLGEYQFAYRTIFAISYLYAPLTVVVSSRSRRDPHVTVVALRWVVPALMLVTPLLVIGVRILQGVIQGQQMGWWVYWWLAAGAGALCIGTFAGRTLIILGRRSVAAAASLVGGLSIVLSAVPMIAMWGEEGAAGASFLGLTISAAIQVRALIRTRSWSPSV